MLTKIENKATLAKVGLVFTTLAWGATFVITDEALKDAPPFTFNAYRAVNKVTVPLDNI